MLGKENLVVLFNFIWLIATKMEEPVLHVRVFINSRIEIVVPRFYSRIINGACIPTTLQYRDHDWESISGLVLAQ